MLNLPTIDSFLLIISLIRSDKLFGIDCDLLWQILSIKLSVQIDTLELVAETHENQQLEVKQKVVDKVERMEVVELPVAAKLLVAK